MKFTGAILLIFASATLAADYPTALEITSDFQKTYEFYNSEATKFVDKLASVLDDRVLSYTAAHQKLLTHFTGVPLIPGVVLGENSIKVLSRITERIQNMIQNIPKVLDRNIFSRELNKHMDMLKAGYLPQAEGLIEELAGYVTKYPALGKCWQENRDEIFKIVENGFIAARDAAITTVSSSNSSLNTNELLMNSLIAADNSMFDICKQIDVNACLAGYFTTADIVFPISSSVWESTTNATISVNLQVSEGMIKTAAQIAILQITQVINKIENCVSTVLAEENSS